jgi:hypothetical protein
MTDEKKTEESIKIPTAWLKSPITGGAVVTLVLGGSLTFGGMTLSEWSGHTQTIARELPVLVEEVRGLRVDLKVTGVCVDEDDVATEKAAAASEGREYGEGL